MERSELISRTQFTALGVSALMSPVIRVVPVNITVEAGSLAWLSAIVAIGPLVYLLAIILRLQRGLAPGEGMEAVFTRVFGRFLGSVFLILMSIWLLFYAGYSLHISAVRFISTIYPGSSKWGFIPLMGLMLLTTGLGRVKTLSRSAMIFAPLLLITFGVGLIFSMQDIDLEVFYLPVAADMKGVVLGSLPVVSAIAVMAYLPFLESYVPHETLKFSRFLPKLFLIIGAVILLCITTIGTFGPIVINDISAPFFVMLCNVTLFNVIERFEAVVIAIWFFTDFLLTSLLLQAVLVMLHHSFRLQPKGHGRFFDLRNRRWLVWICVAISITFAFLMAPTVEEQTFFAFKLIPTVSLIIIYSMFSLLFVVGLVRKRI